jgi:PAS domain S-box-containing protein
MAESTEFPSSAVLDGPTARAFLEGAPDGLLLVDADGVIRYANAAASQLSGHPGPTLLGQSVELLVPVASAASHIRLRNTYLGSPRNRPMGGSMELAMRRSDGSEVPVEIGLAPVHVGDSVQVAVSIRDVSERRQADRERRHLVAQLAENEQYFRSAFEGAPVGMVVTELRPGGARIVTRSNEQFAAILDTTCESLIGADLRDVTHPDDVATLAVELERMVEGQQVALRRDLRYRRPDGAYVWTDEQTVRMHAAGPAVLTLSHVVDTSAVRAKQDADARSRLLEASIAALVSDLLESGVSEATYSTIAARAAQLTGATDAAVIMWNPDLGSYQLVGTDGPIAGAFATSGMQPPAALIDRVHMDEAVVALDPNAFLPVPFSGRLAEVLAAPLRFGDRVSGVLVLARPMGSSVFPAFALATLEVFTKRVALAVAAAQGRSAETRVRLLDDRERIARDLHDTVIQDLFAAGMRISAALPRVADETAAARLNDVIDQIDATIKKVRAVVFDLHTQQPGRATVTQLVSECVHEAARALTFTPTLELGGELDEIPSRLHDHLLGVLREGLSNVARHAQASSASVSVRVVAGRVSVRITDNGVGLGSDVPAGSGTRNIVARAAMLGGEATIANLTSGHGTELLWSVPVSMQSEV